MNLFAGRTMAIATMHKKESIISPIVSDLLGVSTVVPKNFNTDVFGTFTREIRRNGTQIEAARKKAYAALQLTGLDLVVASEGSFVTDANVPLLHRNTELILCIDTKYKLEIIGQYSTTDTNALSGYVFTTKEALEFAQKIGFPEHGIIVRKSPKSTTGIQKDIVTQQQFITVVESALAHSFRKRVFLETDMRADRNPTRQKVIEQAARRLVQNMTSYCSHCSMPGFAAVDYELGLPCKLCTMPTKLPLYEVLYCQSCHFKEKRRILTYGKVADPQHCGFCNP